MNFPKILSSRKPYAATGAFLKKQKLIFWSLLSGSALLLFVFIYSLMEPETQEAKATGAQTEATDKILETAVDHVDPRKIWVERLETQNKLLAEEVKTLKNLVEKTTQVYTNERLEMAQRFEEMEKRAQRTQAEIQERDAYLREELTAAQKLPQEGTAPALQPQGTAAHSVGGMIDSFGGSRLQKITLNLQEGYEGTKIGPTVETFIPAGTIATGILMNRMDVSTSVEAPAHPQPALIRLVDEGKTPRQLSSKLKQCHLIADTWGDIGSLRVQMRVHTLSCVEENGEVQETEISGFITGEDGGVGIRGHLIDRAGPELRAAFTSGLISGVSKFFTANTTAALTPLSPLGVSRSLSPTEMLKGAGSEGVGKSLDRLTQYYIKQAERLQPVLEIAGGRRITVVFQKGTAFGDTSVRQTIARTRNRAREEDNKKTVQTMLGKGPLKQAKEEYNQAMDVIKFAETQAVKGEAQ